jgi:hypothetical protein
MLSYLVSNVTTTGGEFQLSELASRSVNVLPISPSDCPKKQIPIWECFFANQAA